MPLVPAGAPNSRSGIAGGSGRLGKNLSLHPNAKVVAVFDDQIRIPPNVVREGRTYRVRVRMQSGSVVGVIGLIRLNSSAARRTWRPTGRDW